MYRIIWADQAEENYLDTIMFWIDHNKSKAYSEKLIDEVEKTEDLLSENPFLGVKSEFPHTYKTIVLNHFSLYYRLKDTVIEIVAFWDNRRNPENLESIL